MVNTSIILYKNSISYLYLQAYTFQLKLMYIKIIAAHRPLLNCMIQVSISVDAAFALTFIIIIFATYFIAGVILKERPHLDLVDTAKLTSLLNTKLLRY